MFTKTHCWCPMFLHLSHETALMSLSFSEAKILARKDLLAVSFLHPGNLAIFDF